MGLNLARPETSVLSQRVDDIAFRVGYGARAGDGLEDGLVIFAQPTWGFFGVFGGHGGDQSRFIATRIEEELLKSGMPEDNAAVTALALRLDEEFSKKFLGSNPSASDFTGTFVIVKAPSTQESKYHLRVGNIGDGGSRFLLGRADGSIPRPGPEPQDHPVCAGLKLKEFKCGPTDFLMLLCDGISEGRFSKEAVVKLAAEKLIPDQDPEKAALAVLCHEAMQEGFKKHLSCMIVLLGGKEVLLPVDEGEDDEEPPQAPVPGVTTAPGSAKEPAQASVPGVTTAPGSAKVESRQKTPTRVVSVTGCLAWCGRES